MSISLLQIAIRRYEKLNKPPGPLPIGQQRARVSEREVADHFKNPANTHKDSFVTKDKAAYLHPALDALPKDAVDAQGYARDALRNNPEAKYAVVGNNRYDRNGMVSPTERAKFSAAEKEEMGIDEIIKNKNLDNKDPTAKAQRSLERRQAAITDHFKKNPNDKSANIGGTLYTRSGIGSYEGNTEEDQKIAKKLLGEDKTASSVVIGRSEWGRNGTWDISTRMVPATEEQKSSFSSKIDPTDRGHGKQLEGGQLERQQRERQAPAPKSGHHYPPGPG